MDLLSLTRISNCIASIKLMSYTTLQESGLSFKEFL